MIPRAHITAWRTQVPWPSDAQVEQDLIVSRALVEMYARPPHEVDFWQPWHRHEGDHLALRLVFVEAAQHVDSYV